MAAIFVFFLIIIIVAAVTGGEEEDSLEHLYDIVIDHEYENEYEYKSSYFRVKLKRIKFGL